MRNGIHSRSKWLIAATAAVAIIAGGLALGSNMGFKFNAQVTLAGTPLPKGDNWLTIPDNSPYNKAQQLCQHLGLASTGASTGRGIVSRLNATTGLPQTYTCGQSTALAFNTIVGEGLRVRNPSTINGIIVGSDNPSNTTAIVAAATPLPKGDNWVSVPYHTTAIKSHDLCADIGLTSTGASTGRGIVSRLNSTTGLPQTYTCGQSSALAFNLVTGEAARIRNPVAKSWLPSHF
jgi:hypothetical protein